MDCGIPYCHHRLPGQQPDPGLERPRLSRRLAGGRAQPAFHQQFPGIHRPRLPGAVRGVLHAQHRRQPGHHQDDRMRHRRSRLRGGLGQAGAAGGARPASRSPSSARDRPGLPARSSSRAPATTCTSTRSSPSPAACCATASPTSRWRSITSTAASRRWRRRACASIAASMSASMSPAEELVAEHDAVVLAGGAEKGARPADARAASSRASISPWSSCRSRTGASPTSRRATPSRSSPPASTSW